MKCRPSRSVHDLVANSCVSILNKFNPSDQEEGLKFLCIHEVPKWAQVILKYWESETQITQLAASFGRENDLSHSVLAEIWGHNDIGVLGSFSP